jgi:hypothetical protein
MLGHPSKGALGSQRLFAMTSGIDGIPLPCRIPRPMCGTRCDGVKPPSKGISPATSRAKPAGQATADAALSVSSSQVRARKRCEKR